MERERNIYTIPNLLTLFRLCLIPVLVWFYCMKEDLAQTAGVTAEKTSPISSRICLWGDTVSMESTMLIPAIERSGIAVASRQAKMEIIEASAIAKTGTATGCKRCL